MRVGAAVAEVEVEDTVCSGKILAAVLAQSRARVADYLLES